MYGSSYRLYDLDGQIIVIETTSDWNNPILRDTYWPTKIRTRDLLYFYDDIQNLNGLVESATVSKTLPYEFTIKFPQSHPESWRTLQRIELEHGNDTRPVKTEEREYKRPRGTSRVEYIDGHWFKYLKSGCVRC